MHECSEDAKLKNPEYRKKLRDNFARAILGSGLLSQLSAQTASTAMFDLAEEMMNESERRYAIDKEELAKRKRLLQRSTRRATSDTRPVQETGAREDERGAAQDPV